MNKNKFVEGIQWYGKGFTVSRTCHFADHMHIETHYYPIKLKEWTFERCERRNDRVSLLLYLDIQRRLRPLYDEANKK
jgi:hypothetical protein